MFIDCHTHAFADKIAEKAVIQLIEYYQLPTSFGGRLADLLFHAADAGLDGLILLVAATKPEQVKPANDWVLALKGMTESRLQEEFGVLSARADARPPYLIPFGTFHLEDPDWGQEINRLKAAKIQGIKLHPEFQGIDLADPRLGDFFAEVERDFILMIHVGDPKVSDSNFSTPKKIAAILNDFPRLRIIAAHLGGYQFWEEAYQVLAGRDLYLDTSSSLPYINPDLLKRIFLKHGTDRILFGSDYPLRSPKQDLPLLEQIPWLNDTAKEQIKGRNCGRLFGINH
jgi:predicted TIM-barrel fold metal-dependent hydrolase